MTIWLNIALRLVRRLLLFIFGEPISHGLLQDLEALLAELSNAGENSTNGDTE